jgi:hypothetical protein
LIQPTRTTLGLRKQLRREPVCNMSDTLVGNDPRVVVYRERARLAVYDCVQNTRLRLQESLHATGARRVKICRAKIPHAYQK